ncbi:TrbI/VirB10 family protein [Sphingomonas sp.]|uniref:TrbI/VirB10 family protein n=1 Tax=Sphingomonas sp. TaxID=28214 RepID=UPI003F705802
MSAASATAPLQPTDLRLRGKPPRVMRLSRKALATVGMVAAAGIGGSLIYALQPGTQTAPTELYDTDNRATTDGLSAAPKDYSEVPKLGPPLPGDLGRPILSAQQRGTDVAPPPMGTPSPPASAAPSPGQTARERARDEQDAARTSRMFIGSAAPVPSAPAANAPPPAMADGAVEPLPPPAAGQGDQAAKRAFLDSGGAAASESGFRIVAPSSGSIVQAGSIIPAALITGIRSDLPGMITAQVTENVYDSVTGRHLLIPQGSRLLGDYDSQVSPGQSRVLLAWTRLILPDGRSILLDRLPGADTAGYAGLQDRVNHHWGGIFRSALISTLLSIGTEVGSASDDDLVRAIRQGGSQSIGRTGQDLVRRQMGIQPTLQIRPGFPLRVIVTRDLVLASHGVAK